ncbi:MAG TPA: YdeI/OmpD-associated family protein [Puia sp.]|nr:YdeI/OmpD-associated family protein [Puia sp.]
MVEFTTTILQFAKQGEKTGWTYIKIPAAIAQQLKPGNKKSFRVKGQFDDHQIKGVSLIPMGEGDFIIALNTSIRKAIGKNKGAKLHVQIEVDYKKPQPPAELLECLKDEPEALIFFKQLSGSHQNYFSNWIKSAKTEATKAKRIALCVNAMSKKFDFGQMMRSAKKDKEDFFR